MEGDHDLIASYIQIEFSETVPIAIDGEFIISGISSKLKLASAALSIPRTPAPRLPSPGGRGRCVGARWCRYWRHQ